MACLHLETARSGLAGLTLALLTVTAGCSAAADEDTSGSQAATEGSAPESVVREYYRLQLEPADLPSNVVDPNIEKLFDADAEIKSPSIRAAHGADVRGKKDVAKYMSRLFLNLREGTKSFGGVKVGKVEKTGNQVRAHLTVSVPRIPLDGIQGEEPLADKDVLATGKSAGSEPGACVGVGTPLPSSSDATRIELDVVDVFDFNASGKITLLRPNYASTDSEADQAYACLAAALPFVAKSAATFRPNENDGVLPSK